MESPSREFPLPIRGGIFDSGERVLFFFENLREESFLEFLIRSNEIILFLSGCRIIIINFRMRTVQIKFYFYCILIGDKCLFILFKKSAQKKIICI